MRRVAITLAALTTLTTLTTLAVPAASSALASSQPAATKPATAKPAAPEIRLNQVGYAPDAPKSASVMLPARVASVPFTVTDTSGKVVFRGVSRDDVGPWNAGYQAVYLLSFSGLRQCGTYRVRVGATTSPTFKIANGTALYAPLVNNAVRYFTSERDGPTSSMTSCAGSPPTSPTRRRPSTPPRATTTTTTWSARSRRSAAR